MESDLAWSCPFDPHETLDYLTGHPNLHSLDLALLDASDVEAKMVGDAVASQASLDTLTIMLDSTMNEEKKSSPTSLWPIDSLLTAVFLEPGRKSTVSKLVIDSSGTDGDMMRLGLLPDVLRVNKGIKELIFKWHGDDGCTREEMHELLGVLRNTSIESLVLPNLVRWDFPNDEDLGFIDAESLAQVVELVQHNSSINKLELHVGECRGTRNAGDVMNLDAFYRALSANSSIQSLSLRGPFYTPIAETEFSNWIRTTLSLQELQMEGDSDESPVAKLLFQALRENKSLRRLELEDFVVEEEDKDVLMDSLKVNVTLREIYLRPEYCPMDDVREVLRKNQEQ